MRKLLGVSLAMLVLAIGACGCMGGYPSPQAGPGSPGEPGVIASGPGGQGGPEAQAEAQAGTGAQAGAQADSGGSARDRVIGHMESKYPDDSFYYEPADPGGSGSVTVRSGKYPDARIVVLYSNENGAYSFSDNYAYFRYEDEASQLIGQVLADTLRHDFRYYFIGSPATGAFGTGDVSSLDEFVSNPLSSLSFAAVLSPGFHIGGEAEFEARLNNAFKARNIVIKDADLLFAGEDDGYEELGNTGLTNYMHRHSGLKRLTVIEAGTDQAVFIWR